MQCHLSLFKPDFENRRTYILNFEIIYVGGGNTFNMLAIWKAWSLDTILVEAWKKGIILCGISAGSICWFEQGLTDSFSSTEYREMDCLGLIKGSNCPHYNNEKGRRETYKDLIKTKVLKSGIDVDDCAALHYVNGELKKNISSKKEAKAYDVFLHNNEISEKIISPEFLG